MAIIDIFNKSLLKLIYLFGFDLVQVPSDPCIEHADYILRLHRSVLLLLEKLCELLSSVQQTLGGCVQVGSELGKSSDLSILGKIKFEGSCNLLHRLKLGVGANPGD